MLFVQHNQNNYILYIFLIMTVKPYIPDSIYNIIQGAIYFENLTRPITKKIIPVLSNSYHYPVATIVLIMIGGRQMTTLGGVVL